MEDMLALCALIALHGEHSLSFQQKENSRQEVSQLGVGFRKSPGSAGNDG